MPVWTLHVTFHFLLAPRNLAIIPLQHSLVFTEDGYITNLCRSQCSMDDHNDNWMSTEDTRGSPREPQNTRELTFSSSEGPAVFFPLSENLSQNAGAWEPLTARFSTVCDTYLYEKIQDRFFAAL